MNIICRCKESAPPSSNYHKVKHALHFYIILIVIFIMCSMNHLDPRVNNLSTIIQYNSRLPIVFADFGLYTSAKLGNI